MHVVMGNNFIYFQLNTRPYRHIWRKKTATDRLI